MANRAFFLLHDESSPVADAEERECTVLAASNQIPLLWLSVFDSTSIHRVSRTVEGEDGEKQSVLVPNLHAALPEALARFMARQEYVQANLPPELRVHVAEWESLLRGAQQRYCQLEPLEVWCMEAPEVFEADLSVALAAFADRSLDGWIHLLTDAGFQATQDKTSYRYDPEVVRFGLRGYQWSGVVPWDE